MKIDNIIFWTFFWTIIFFVYFSIIEWAVHRFPMHKKEFAKIPILGFFFKTHIDHHKDFNVNYECHSGHDDHDNHIHSEIVLPWWSGILLSISATLPFLIIESFIGFKNLSITCFALAYVYYWLFEWIHVAMHESKSWQRKFFGVIGVFNYLQNHHKKHHSSWSCNFNLLCPTADYLFGTKK